MYPEFFGLTEASFSITPDPHYLYLSRRHREALAHLMYGAGEGGGFVLLTGEVGTGKTTICRAFLEQLPEQVDLALVLNPALTVTELLHTVCDEFGIQVPAGEDSAKVLVDRLNAFLLEAHAAGRRPVLMIDEAQNLSAEVLEQIRLLTNLETAKHKLLQIFLVGQPELRELLVQDHLRQLAQRITARFHLTPLDAGETAEYVRHRLAVAGARHPLFTAGALRRIHRLSQGIPRLVNILCDRSLLGAYATRRDRVDTKIVNRAARELRGESDAERRLALRRWLAWAALLVLSAGLAWLWTHTGTLHLELPLLAASTPGAVAPALAPEKPATEPPAVSQDEGDSAVPAVASDQEPEPQAPAGLPEGLVFARRAALEALLTRWARPLPPPDTEDLCGYAASQGLSCREGSGTWNNLRFYRRPTLIRLRHAGQEGYALVVGLSAERVALGKENGTTWVAKSQVEPRWFGEFLFLWQLPPGGTGLIGPRSPAQSVRWLRSALTRVAGKPLETAVETPWDLELKKQVRAFQTASGLQADGIAGPETLIQLNSAAGLPDIPHLDLGN
jgi:general secretion pathway protein A